MTVRHCGNGKARAGSALAGLTLGAGLAIAVGWMPAAHAAFPGTPGRIAFNSFENDIYTIRTDGTGLRRLTFDGRSANPRWSPDGTRIAFNRRGNIFVMSVTGTNVRQVTTFGRSYQPAWSPDGTRLVFVHVPAGTPGDIWVVRVAGGTPRRLTNDTATSCGDSHPVWSPLGGRIAYTQHPLEDPCSVFGWTEGGSVLVHTLATGARTQIPYAWDPDFTADGQGLFYSTNFDTEGNYFINGDYAWSNLTGGNRSLVTSDYCAEGDACFQEGAASPTSGFTEAADFLHVRTYPGHQCVSILASSFCRDIPGLLLRNVDVQPLG